MKKVTKKLEKIISSVIDRIEYADDEEVLSLSVAVLNLVKAKQEAETTDLYL